MAKSRPFQECVWINKTPFRCTGSVVPEEPDVNLEGSIEFSSIQVYIYDVMHFLNEDALIKLAELLREQLEAH